MMLRVLTFTFFILMILSFGESNNNPTIEEKVPLFQTNLYNHTMKWGTYRPQVIFGMKTRSPKPILNGLMWYKADTENGIERMRHDSTMDIENVRYGWERHDGQNFGLQNVQDYENQISLETILLKNIKEITTIEDEEGEYKNYVNQKGGDWTVKISGKPLKSNRPNDQIISVLFYVAFENDEISNFKISGVQGSRKQGLSSPIIIRGENEDVGPFYIHLSTKDKAVESYDGIYFYGVKRKEVWNINTEVKRMLNDKMQELLKNKEDRTVLTEYPTLPNTIEDDSNVIVFQKFVRVPFEMDIVFLSHEQNPDIYSNFHIKEKSALLLDNLDKSIKERKELFEKRFEQVFHLEKLNFPEVKEMAMFALSNLIGGIGHFHGNSYHKYGDNPQVHVIPPYSLFTACPSRSFFPRGFLWDEGFHSLLIQRWNKEIAKDIITNWFNVMDKKTGWIPREQILGDEARSRVPQEFQVQHDTHANPPMLFFAVFELIQSYLQSNQFIEINIEASQSYSSEPPSTESESMISFLKQVYPLMKINYEWYLKTQQGRALHSYRWRGRTPGHTLSSGLDDFPRGTDIPSDDERHLDLFSWIYMMTDTMNKIHKIIYNTESKELVERMQNMKDNIKSLHWNSNIKWFSDYAGEPRKYLNETRPAYSPHVGYISLFPFFFGLVQTSTELDRVLNFVIKEKLLTLHGLNSLSMSDPLYGTKENYWRGPIWININYLTLRSLYKCKDETKLCEQLYNTTRDRLVTTLGVEWRRSKTLYEQYNAETGHGQGARPFTGWTSLIALILGELY
ncbi:hypothetical protein ABK040_008837 [Willaertia magna]